MNLRLPNSLYVKPVASVAAFAMLISACGADTESAEPGASDNPDDSLATVVVTTDILGDVVENLVGDDFTVETIMPAGSNPHDFQPSAQQVAQIDDADVLISNGASFEEGLLDVVQTAEADGVPVFEAISAIETLEFTADEGGHQGGHHGDEEHSDEEHSDKEGGHSDKEHSDESGHSDHGDEEDGDKEHSDESGHSDHGDEEHGEHEEHAHDGVDPHFFTDPGRMALAAEAIVEFLAETVDAVSVDVLRSSAEAYIEELKALDAEVSETLASIPEEQRVLVTDHEVFGYFADSYDLEIVGTVIPGFSTSDGVAAEELAELAEVVESEGVPAVFADSSSSDDLAQTLAAEVDDIKVVELYSETLGPEGSDGASYVDLVRTNATRIADALGG